MAYLTAILTILNAMLLWALIHRDVRIRRLKAANLDLKYKLLDANHVADEWSSRYSNSVLTNKHLKVERDKLQAQLMVKQGASKN